MSAFPSALKVRRPRLPALSLRQCISRHDLGVAEIVGLVEQRVKRSALGGVVDAGMAGSGCRLRRDWRCDNAVDEGAGSRGLLTLSADGNALMHERERNGAGVRDIEAFDRAGEIEAGQTIASLARQPS